MVLHSKNPFTLAVWYIKAASFFLIKKKRPFSILQINVSLMELTYKCSKILSAQKHSVIKSLMVKYEDPLLFFISLLLLFFQLLLLLPSSPMPLLFSDFLTYSPLCSHFLPLSPISSLFTL